VEERRVRRYEVRVASYERPGYKVQVAGFRVLVASARGSLPANAVPDRGSMTRYVIFPDVALRLAVENAVLPPEHQLLAPTLLRSQLLARLYRLVREGSMTKQEAGQHLSYVRGLRIRLLGDRVLQDVAWQVADQLGWPDTMDAEYIALTRLQGDALITLDEDIAAAAAGLVAVAPFAALLRPDAPP
jgi:predicted nucleic acid-binding protein